MTVYTPADHIEAHIKGCVQCLILDNGDEGLVQHHFYLWYKGKYQPKALEPPPVIQDRFRLWLMSGGKGR